MASTCRFLDLICDRKTIDTFKKTFNPNKSMKNSLVKVVTITITITIAVTASDALGEHQVVHLSEQADRLAW